MRRPLHLTAVVCLVVLGCATSYQPYSSSGGFQETQLSGRSYQIRFEGNDFTTHSQVTGFVLRRAAELTLESGHRFFTLSSQESQTRGHSEGSAPSRSAVVHFLDSNEAAAIDAVLVIRDTDAIAEGKLSERAREALASIQP